MAQASPRQHHTAARGAAQREVTLGGPIADMQRTIEERMTAAEWHMPSVAPAGTDLAHRLSRVAGPALLGTAYLAIAFWWF